MVRPLEIVTAYVIEIVMVSIIEISLTEFD
jgi:hypothetical protein